MTNKSNSIERINVTKSMVIGSGAKGNFNRLRGIRSEEPH